MNPARALPVVLLAGLFTGPARAQLAPLPYDQGAAGLGLALRRLGVTARVLYVTAHPDDEHNGVLVKLSRGQGLRTALFTLTRGEGGQNEIGSELFDALGVLRTEELMAVHRYDAAEQYFGRAYEFGYSFSVEESFEKWGKEETLGDVVKVVRRFRPDVILTLPLEAPGGGQHHQAAARLAVEAFRAAADPGRFPDHLRQGLRPWQARKVYQGGVGGSSPALPGPPPVAVPLGALDPLLGLSWQELGSVARASHRSQSQGQLKARPGEGQGLYVLVDSEPAVTGSEADVLDGVDPSLAGLARFVRADEPAAAGLSDELEALQSLAEACRTAYDARSPERTVEPLAAYLERLRQVEDRLRREGGRADLLERLHDEERDALAALPLAEGIAFEAVSEDGDVVPGQAFTVTATVWHQGSRPIRFEGLSLRAPEGWAVRSIDEAPPAELSPGQRRSVRFDVTVAPDARYAQPYWRRRAGADRFDLDIPAHESLPWSPPDLQGTLSYRAGGTAAALEQPVVWRYEGPLVGGEKQKVVQVVPAVSVAVAPALTVVPLGTRAPRLIQVSVLNNEKGAGEVALRLAAPPAWKVDPAEVPLSFRYEGEQMAARFRITPPVGLPAGEYAVQAVARRGGRTFEQTVEVIAYHHTQERHLVHRALARARALDVRLPPGLEVAYVMGTGDAVADALVQLGVPVTLLGPDDLAYGDLKRFTTIVTGIRAYQARRDLRSYHQRLLRYVEQGGHLVVQYDRPEAFNTLFSRAAGGGLAPVDSPFAPYAAAVTLRRITDENAPVTVLVPAHPLFREPNRIGPSDWHGWVQERGAYFLEARDPRYVDLVAMTDPFPKNPGEKKGALTEAKVGRGTWTYVGLGLFRQIPAGTPGAWRLLANLVSRPRAL